MAEVEESEFRATLICPRVASPVLQKRHRLDKCHRQEAYVANLLGVALRYSFKAKMRLRHGRDDWRSI